MVADIQKVKFVFRIFLMFQRRLYYIWCCFAFIGCWNHVLGVPEGFILNVDSQCADDVSGVATISVTTDVDIVVDVYCKDNFRLEVSSSDSVHYTAEVKYTGNSATECVFRKLNNSEIYRVKVVMGYGDPKSHLYQYTDEYMVTCTYDSNQFSNSSGSGVGERVLAPDDIQQNRGDVARSVFTLDVTDVRDDVISGSIPLGKKIQLRATMSDPTGIAEDEVSALAVGCKVVGDGAEYKILRGGCGDGVIFAVDRGFQTSGKIIRSPFFSAFHMYGSDFIKFECNFTVCTANCDGSSCYKETSGERRKREASTVKTSRICAHAETLNFKLLQTGSVKYRHFRWIQHLLSSIRKQKQDYEDAQSPDASNSTVTEDTSNNRSESPSSIVKPETELGRHDGVMTESDCRSNTCSTLRFSFIIGAATAFLLGILLVIYWKGVKSLDPSGGDLSVDDRLPAYPDRTLHM